MSVRSTSASSLCGEIGKARAVLPHNSLKSITRWKNPNPKRAENARTVLKGDYVSEEEERGGEEEKPVAVLRLKIPPPAEDDGCPWG